MQYPASASTSGALRKTVTLCLGMTLLAYLGLAFLGTQIIVYDTAHFGDTLFILGVGWRSVNGLIPTLDFGHFYGGFTAMWIALAMKLFGPSVHAYALACLVIFAAATCAVALISWTHLSRTSFLMVLLVIAALLFTKHPLEVDQSVTRLWSTHSFLYNRIGFVQLLLCCLFIACPSRSRLRDILTGCLVGTIALAAAYTKPTFAILLPAVALALAVQTRWAALVGLTTAVAGIVVIFDPGAQRFFASFAYVQASVGERDEAQITSLIRKSIQIVLAQPIALMLVVGGALAASRYDRRGLQSVLAIFLCAAAGVGMAATMGGGGALGQLALPIAAAILLSLTARARARAATQTTLLELGSLVLVAALCLPHLLNLAGASAEAVSKRAKVAIESGPLASYLSLPEVLPDGGRATQYQMLSDGVAALTTLGVGPEHGIIADNGLTFEFAMLAKPVPGYPMWQRPSAPELAPNQPMADDADVVMLGRGVQADPDIGPLLRAKLGPAFALCARTGMWEIHVRRSLGLTACLQG